MSCEKNILELPLDASAPDPTDVVIYTKADGSSVIRRVSTVRGSFLNEVYDCVGTEGFTINIPALVGVGIGRIVDIIRNGSSCRKIVQSAPSGLDIYYDDGAAGDVTVATEIVAGEFFKVIYQ